MGRELVDLEVEVKDESDKAWKVFHGDTDRTVWLPKSVCELDPEPAGLPAKATLRLPENWAIDKELV